MKIINAEQVHQNLNFEELILLLKQSFCRPFTMPQRRVYSLAPEQSENHDAFALLPSWNEEVIGNKAFTYFPDNAQQHDLPGLFSKIMLFKRQTGEPLALVDGTSVTYWRTAAISALASQLLSRENSENLMLFGTGNLASYLVKAHLAVRDIKQVTLWGRNSAKVRKLIDSFSVLYPAVTFKASTDVNHEVISADIICCATGAKTPLFDGNRLSAGCHIDCLGNHMTDARECDTTTVTRARVFVDSLTNTLNEAGELLIPMAEGAFNKNEIVGELADMCKTPAILRQSNDEITLFKSVGTAISDLVAAHSVVVKLAK
ncbi:bifunctional Delta(1)-pyrroline-2-carboxylate/Delta(1)-piperideine-2-carboxylate reductase [Colwellia psychrerythraea]|uniref:Ornithine cyclodeaminase/mu-crystallin n=1 Tax=Colwellia psychrerythraea TaxID=28229 RepID=A0A099KKU6_COLPS|nr:ornithine cyclodeaminase family protein [Colwellia psychrerythraea]KGJ91424.1 ornithine cyclodeaminase/mu-crystallin [Colwellia psychrerythraea]